MGEAASALDPIATLRIEELIAELKRRFTIVIVTHNLQQAGGVSDTTALLLQSELVEHAPTKTIFTNPSDDGCDRRGDLLDADPQQDGLDGHLRRPLAPQLVDEAIRRDEFVGGEDQAR